MATSRKSRNVYDEEKILAQFTSGQLVVALSVAIFVCCVCYMLGMLTERYYAARQEGPIAGIATAPANAPLPAPAAPSAPAPPAAAPPAAPETSAQSGTVAQDLLARARSQAEPRTTTLPAEGESGARTMPPLPAAGRNERPTRSTTLAIPAPQQRIPGEPAAAPETTPAPEASTAPEPPLAPNEPGPAPESEETPAAVETAKATTVPEDKPEPAPTKPPAEKPRPETSAKAPAAQPPPALQPSDPPEEVPVAGRGAFGVQLAAFKGDKGKAQADDFKQMAKKKLNIDSEVIRYEDGYYRVLKVGFKDRAAASKAAEALRKQDEFKGCFVQPLP